jgi:hypothetical protein
MDSIKQPSDVPVSQINIGPLKTMGNGVTKLSFLTFNEKQFSLQLPEMYAPFGINIYNNADSGIVKYSLMLAFRNLEQRASLQTFKTFLDDVDDMIIEHALKNSNAWFRKNYTNKEVVSALFTRSIKYPIDKDTGDIIDKYPPNFKVNLPFKNNKFMLETYDKTANPIKLENIIDSLKGAKIITILQSPQIWLAGGKFGITWKATQLQITPRSAITGFAIQNVKEDKIEDDNIDEIDEKVNEIKLDNNLIDNSDEE